MVCKLLTQFVGQWDLPYTGFSGLPSPPLLLVPAATCLEARPAWLNEDF